MAVLQLDVVEEYAALVAGLDEVPWDDVEVAAPPAIADPAAESAGDTLLIW